jgi:hypothetical protein
MAEEIKNPEEIKAIAEAKKRALEKLQAEMERVKLAINSASENENVRIILKHVVNLCGFRSNPVVINELKDAPTNSMMYNVGRLSIFHDLRKLMSAETENLIEKREE